MFNIFKKLFDNNEKQLRKAEFVVDEVNHLEDEIKKLSIEDIKKELSEYKSKLKLITEKITPEKRSSIITRNFEEDLSGEEKEIIVELQRIMPRVFAIVREVTRRSFDRRHFDVQIMAGVVLAWGNKLVELQTGEGKTQVFFLPTALYALTGRGAHVVTVNDYLAKRDGEYAGYIMADLGLSVGIIVPDKSYKFVPDQDLKTIKGEDVYEERKNTSIKNPGDVKGLNLIECSKKEAYGCDIVYGTNNEFGFDYLRDNMISDTKSLVQRELYYCIVDEVDSILIDEARTPLIISTMGERSNEYYEKFAKLIPRLENEIDYTIDEKAHNALLTDTGIEKIEKLLGVKNLWEDSTLAYHLENSLKAYTLYKRDDEYIVKDGQVLIVDEFTGRVLPGRRYSEGLHQAIEAKEGVEIKQESKTMATITFQNFFRLYKVLGGGSGTVMTEAEEFYKIYHIDSVVIPTNKKVIRIDQTDRIYKDKMAKFNAVTEEIKQAHKKGQPILAGTSSIENSEIVSRMLDKIGIQHEVLNAKHHEREAHIIEKAGQLNAVTIATNMAGRGTDIKLGDGVDKLGGLYVIGTERHEARRIDNQLRGRSGRQGDPGESRFYVALDDEIMRIQGGDKLKKVLEITKVPDDMPIENKFVSNSIERAQKRMEGYHFDIRNNVVKYDDVMNKQREIFYQKRRNLLVNYSKDFETLSKDKNKKSIQKKYFQDLLKDEVNYIVSFHTVQNKIEEEVYDELLDFSDDDLIKAAIQKLVASKKLDIKFIDQNSRAILKLIKRENLEEYFNLVLIELWNSIESSIGILNLLNVAKLVMLQTMDQLWTDHLTAMKDLREGIGLRGVAQRDPLVEYKNEAFNYFEILMNNIRSKFAKRIFKVKRVEGPASSIVKTNEDQIEDVLTGTREMVIVVKNFVNKTSERQTVKKEAKQIPLKNTAKFGRNDPCPCGSGKKYKKCHGKNL